jgi:hypothetical protein
MVQRYHCTDNKALDKDDEGDFVLYEEHEKLRLLIAEVIVRFSAFDGDFMNRLLNSLGEEG